MKKRNITILENCYGCGVCVAACPVRIISLRENKEGFYSPAIDEPNKCIECGICLKVCAYNSADVASSGDSPEGAAVWSKDPIVRQRCSSGGVGFEIGRTLIERGYEAVGVKYNLRAERAEHFVASTVEEFTPSIGSKYIPSFTEPGFLSIDRKKKYLVTGAPCQIDSIRRLIRHWRVEENFILLDFFCHGTPSMLLWRKYMESVKKDIGEPVFVSWRNKQTGWHDSWSICADPRIDSESIDRHDSYNIHIFEKKHFLSSRFSQGDLFYRFFLGNVCLNRCCYHACKYKLSSSAADIRIGDYWGKDYEKDEFGTSSVIAMTARGKTLLSSLSNRCEIESRPVENVTQGQMPRSPSKPVVRDKIIRSLSSAAPLASAVKILSLYRIACIPKRAVNKIYFLLFNRNLFH